MTLLKSDGDKVSHFKKWWGHQHPQCKWQIWWLQSPSAHCFLHKHSLITILLKTLTWLHIYYVTPDPIRTAWLIVPQFAFIILCNPIYTWGFCHNCNSREICSTKPSAPYSALKLYWLRTPVHRMRNVPVLTKPDSCSKVHK